MPSTTVKPQVHAVTRPEAATATSHFEEVPEG
jgi:hypothetical protein